MSAEPLRVDQGLEVRQAAEVYAHLDPGIECRRPPGHGAAHRDAQGGDARLVYIRTRDQIVQGAHTVVDHHAPEHLTLPQHLRKEIVFGASPALAKIPAVDAQGGVTAGAQRCVIGRILQRLAATEKFVLAELVIAAVGVVVEDAG